MPVVWRLDRIMAKYEISLKQLADRVGITQVNLSRIKTGKSRRSALYAKRSIANQGICLSTFPMRLLINRKHDLT